MTQTKKHGILLVNLGTADAPQPQAIKRFLSEFLSDKRVVDAPSWWWQPLLKGIILPIRAPKVAKIYQSVWFDEGSPLLVYSKAQVKALSERVNMPVALGMTYGNPSTLSGVNELLAQGCTDLIVLPLFPQNSGTTTGAASDALSRALMQTRAVPSYQFIHQYYDHPLYIKALAQKVRDHWQANGKGDYLVCSYHGIPQRYADLGDVYPQQCEATTAALAKALDLDESQIGMAYQSRFGREEWLKPYTSTRLKELAQSGVASLDVISPAFSVDCIETLEEIAQECRDEFLEAGGKAFQYIECLNAEPSHIDLLEDLIRTAMK